MPPFEVCLVSPTNLSPSSEAPVIHDEALFCSRYMNQESNATASFIGKAFRISQVLASDSENVEKNLPETDFVLH